MGRIQRSTNECRIWTKQVNRKYGYGLVHRVIYEYIYGEIPDGFEIHHTCKNPLCFNHLHLKAISKKEHFAMRRKTHCQRGHELTPDNVYTSRGKRTCKICKIAGCKVYQRNHRAQYAKYQRDFKERQKAACQ